VENLTQIAPKHKILAACIDPPGKDKANAPKSLEFVQIERIGSLTGFSVMHTMDPGTAKEHLAVYFTFNQDAPAIAKSVIIHSGTGNAFMEGSVYHVFADGSSGTGRWWLNNGGERIVIQDVAGNFIDEKRFGPHHCSKPQIPSATPVIAASVAPAAFGPLRRG
jgi:hypothetical protein